LQLVKESSRIAKATILAGLKNFFIGIVEGGTLVDGIPTKKSN
jgi:hypothetical protein